MQYVCVCKLSFTTQICQSSNDSVLYLGDSILNLLRNTEYLQVLHAFLHSYQANSRKVGLPWLSTLFQIHYSLSSNHLMLHSLLLTLSLNKLQLNKYLQLIIFDGMCIMCDASIMCWCNLYLFIHMTYMSWNNIYPIYLTLTQHFLDLFLLLLITEKTMWQLWVLPHEGKACLVSDWMVLNFLTSLQCVHKQLIKLLPYSSYQK